MSDLLHTKRTAHASIRGYLYQALLGVERWLALGSESEAADAILCEGDEDLDRLIRDGIRTSEQVKDYSGPLGTGDRVVRETLARFLVSWTTLRRRGEERRFLFTTTARRRMPRSGVDVLALWREPEHRDEVIEGIRHWTRSVKGDEGQVEEALAWLDAQEAWDELLGSIEWRFDAPPLADQRLEVARRLADRGWPGEVRDLLADRLLGRVLEASVAPAVEDRVLTRRDLDQILGATEHDLVQWADQPRARKLRQTLSEAETLLDILNPGYEDISRESLRKLPSLSLVARFEIVPFEETGREAEIGQLTAWCASADPASALLLHGPGGAGKTRLLIEWCRRLRHQGWHAGFLDREADFDHLAPLFRGEIPRLLVLDYGENRPVLAASVLHHLARLRQTGGPKLRLALLARTAGAWWEQLQRDDVAVRQLALESPEPIRVTPLVPAVDDRPRFVARAAQAFAAVHGGTAPPPPAEAAYDDNRYERTLYLHVEALLRVLRTETGGKATADGPLAEILDHERRAWWFDLLESTGKRRISDSVRRPADRSVAVLTLVGGAVTEEEARGLVQIAAPGAREETVENLLDLFHRLYPGHPGHSGQPKHTGGAERFIAPLEPDLLGEELVRQVLARDLSLLDRLLENGTEQQVQDALIVVGRLLQDQTLPAALAERVMVWIGFASRLPVPLVNAAAAATERVLTDHRKAHPEPDEAALRIEAGLLHNLGVRLADLGSLEEALRATEEAVDIRRQLAEKRPRPFLPDLAQSLNNLSNGLAALGRREDALEAMTRTVSTYRQLAQDRPNVFLPDLARSLNNLGLRLGDLGHREAALEAIQEAVDAYRRFVEQRPGKLLPELAASLNSLGNAQAEVGRREDALEAIEQAVDILRPLAEQGPGTFLPDLATSLNDLSLRLADLGRREEALEAIEEAVQIRRQLAELRPDSFLPDLAQSLNNLSNRLADVGRRKEALEASRQAVDAYRQLTAKRADAYLPDLAQSLNNLSNRLSNFGRQAEALEAIEQAVEIRRQLAEQHPDVFLPDLAMSLHNRSLCLADFGRREDALEAIEEAVSIRRTLAKQRPNVFQPNLALSLNNRSLRLADLDRCEEALETVQEAVDIYRQLAENRPDAFLPDLAMSLNNLSVRLADLGRREKALEASEEAVRILGPFFLRLPGAFASQMTTMVRAYRESCDEAGVELDAELLGPIEEVLERLARDGEKAGED